MSAPDVSGKRRSISDGVMVWTSMMYWQSSSEEAKGSRYRHQGACILRAHVAHAVAQAGVPHALAESGAVHGRVPQHLHDPRRTQPSVRRLELSTDSNWSARVSMTIEYMEKGSAAAVMVKLTS